MKKSKMLLLCTLAACGAPGSDAVFTNAAKGSAPDSKQVVAKEPARPAPNFKRYTGLYRRSGDESRFQPCGTRVPLDVFGSFEGRALLAERFRFNSVWQGLPMYGVFTGAVVTDTPRVKGAPDSTAKPVTRFYIIGVDSLRTWQDGDCGGMRVR